MTIDKKDGTGLETRHIVMEMDIPVTSLASQYDSVSFQLRRVIQPQDSGDFTEQFYLRLDRKYPQHSNGIVDIFWGGPYLNMPNTPLSMRVMTNKRTLTGTERSAVDKCIEYVMAQRDDYDHFAFEEYYIEEDGIKKKGE